MTRMGPSSTSLDRYRRHSRLTQPYGRRHLCARMISDQVVLYRHRSHRLNDSETRSWIAKLQNSHRKLQGSRLIRVVRLQVRM